MAGSDDNLRTIGSVQAKTTLSSPNAFKVLQIGAYTFGELEHPPDLEFAGTQELAVKDLIGGTRQGQALGGYYSDITWTGTFRGSDAQGRAIAFDQMRSFGAEQLLKWATERYIVIVREFKHKYRKPKVIEYEITVAVMRDASGSTATANSVDMQLMQLSQQAYESANLIAIQDPSASAAALQNTINSINAKLPSIQPVAQNVGSAASISLGQQLQSAISQASQYANMVSAATGVFPASQLVNANMLTSTLQLMNANISNGQAPTLLQVAGGTLSAVCAQQYGDPTLWPVLAAANGISTNSLPNGVMSYLKLPPLVGGKIA